MFIDMKAQCFMEAARCLNFTRAAEKLYISQPALSKNIAALEQECGMRLFYRDNHRNRVKLTAAGSVMLCEFQKMEKILDGVIEKAQKAESGQEGHLSIGLLSGQIINNIALDVFSIIEEKYPKIELAKTQGSFQQLRQWLEDGTVDMITTFAEEAERMEGILYEEVEQTHMGFAVPLHHPLAKKKALNISDLAGEKVIVPDSRESSIILEKFRHCCHDAGIKVEELIAPDLMNMHLMAELGKGILLTREDSIVTKSPNLKFFECPQMGTFSLVAVWRKDNLNPIITFYHRLYEDIYHER